MLFFKDGIDYFNLNILVFLANILLGCFLMKPVLVVSSVICLAIILLVKEMDYNERHVYLLNQIAMLGVLLPGLYVWLQSNPREKVLAGALFLTAAALYATGLAFSTFGHSPDRDVREFWRFVMHMFSTGGHVALLMEPALMYLFAMA